MDIRFIKRRPQKLPRLEAEEILKSIFESCNKEANDIPLEQLESYVCYRDESYRLQMLILKLALCAFLIIPFLFISPRFTVSDHIYSERGLPEYEIKVEGFFPIKSVIALMDGRRLPVYEINGHTYTIEPTRNGKIKLTVTYLNGQYSEDILKVEGADTEGPRIISLEKEENGLTIRVEDSISGVDYEGSYMELASGQIIYPDWYNEDTGQIHFVGKTENSILILFDNFKNVLKICL